MNLMKKSLMSRILIIEDEKHIAEGIKLNLELQGYAVDIAYDGVSGLTKWKTYRPDLIVLDIMLPGIDGLTILQNIRLEDERIPILILSAKGDLDDRIAGLAYGVDDYLSKPFHLEEFLLRVERLLKRAAWSQQGRIAEDDSFSEWPRIYKFGDNVIDFERCVADCRSGRVHLTGQEIKLLKLFISNRGKPLSRAKLLEIGWGYTRDTTTRTVDNFIVRLRKYFENNPKKPVYFKSLRSVGYIFDHVPQ
jgi:DNA-binding response OmpR family regulator